MNNKNISLIIDDKYIISVKELSEILGVSLSSAYRKITGDTGVTRAEARLLSLLYEVSYSKIVEAFENAHINFQ